MFFREWYLSQHPCKRGGRGRIGKRGKSSWDASQTVPTNGAGCSGTWNRRQRWPACLGKGVTLACLWEEGCYLDLKVGGKGMTWVGIQSPVLRVLAALQVAGAASPSSEGVVRRGHLLVLYQVKLPLCHHSIWAQSLSYFIVVCCLGVLFSLWKHQEVIVPAVAFTLVSLVPRGNTIDTQNEDWKIGESKFRGHCKNRRFLAIRLLWCVPELVTLE